MIVWNGNAPVPNRSYVTEVASEPEFLSLYLKYSVTTTGPYIVDRLSVYSFPPTILFLVNVLGSWSIGAKPEPVVAVIEVAKTA